MGMQGTPCFPKIFQNGFTNQCDPSPPTSFSITFSIAFFLQFPLDVSYNFYKIGWSGAIFAENSEISVRIQLRKYKNCCRSEPFFVPPYLFNSGIKAGQNGLPPHWLVVQDTPTTSQLFFMSQTAISTFVRGMSKRTNESCLEAPFPFACT